MKFPAIAVAALICGLAAPAAVSAAPQPAGGVHASAARAAATEADESLEAPACSTCEGVQLLDAGQFDAAKRIFERQAARGDSAALSDLGWMYQHGAGVAVDYAKAHDLYFQAASRGDNLAMNQMGFLYQNGLGVPQNLTTAYCWYVFALANNYEPSAKHVAELKARGQPEPTGSACAVINHS